jgi:hypothetical protein
VAAGFEVAQPVRDRGVDLVVYKDGEDAKDYVPCLIQLKASSHESFSLDKKYERFPIFLLRMYGMFKLPQSNVYALTFKDALQVMEKEGICEDGLLDEEQRLLFCSMPGGFEKNLEAIQNDGREMAGESCRPSERARTNGCEEKIEGRVHDLGGGRDVRDSSADAAPV